MFPDSIRFKKIMLVVVISLAAGGSAGSVEKFSKMEYLQQSLNNPPSAFSLTDEFPPEPIIAVAEFEPATGVLVHYPLPLPIELIVEMAEDCEVWTVVIDEHQMEEALEDYLAAGADTSHCSFLLAGAPTDWWTRDYGPWYIFNGDDELGIINNDYFWYAPGNVSTDVPIMVADTMGLPFYSTGIRNEGGNYMTDGMGKVIVTNWLGTCNPFTPEWMFQQIYEDYLGIETFIYTGTPLVGLHIDMWAKYLDPGRIIVIDPIIPNAELEEWVDYFKTLMSSYGKPYEVLRVPGVGYSNSLILNNKVLVPQFNWDTDSLALVAYEEAMPGYEVYGYYWPTFSDGDALHCRTHEMADIYMLRIVHIPIHDLENDGNPYHIEANIHPYSNQPVVGSPMIYWKVEGGTYSTIAMNNVTGDEYEAYIPQQPDGTDIYYYIEAEDGSDRIENHPYIGPGNPHHFQVGPDNEPPVVDVEGIPTEMLAIEWPLDITAYALDNRWIREVVVEWSLNGIAQTEVILPLEPPYAVYYTGEMTGIVQSGDIVELRVKAVDTSINQNTEFWPEVGYHTINIASTPNVVAEINPINPPVLIPANGGSFDFEMSATNSSTLTHTFDVWTMITYPGGSQFGPYFEIYDFSLGGLSSAFAERTQNIPAIAPSGIGTYEAYIGTFPDVVWSEDSFEFEKLEMEDGGVVVSGWDNWGEKFSVIAQPTSIVTSEYALHPAYPNPFNPATTIRFDLPEEGKVSLKVFDVNGREVAKLVDGLKPAGLHNVEWNAEGLSSGIYIYRMQAGNFRKSGKMVLVK